MTTQEAIDTIKLAITQIEWDYPMDYAVAFDMAVHRMEKDIPRKPGIGGNQSEGRTWWYICPLCEKAVNKNDNYCGRCGRRLKWE